MAEHVDENFVAALSAMTGPPESDRHMRDPIVPGAPLTIADVRELFDSQIGNRHLDLAARDLRGHGVGFYTIGSSGHEGNAAVARAVRLTDPALLHYRSGAFFIERAREAHGSDPLRDILLGMVAAEAEPIAGGRHKVFGRYDLNIIPQTSTIASHLPRAMGLAFAIERAARLRTTTLWPRDALVVCSFGDASANHSTALGAINAALHTAYQGLPMPLLLVCEDNGIGISTKTPAGWIQSMFSQRAGAYGLQCFSADGCDVLDTFQAASSAARWVRDTRRPALLHLRTVRLMGHAGADFEAAYRNPHEIAAELARDPLIGTARLLIESGAASRESIRAAYERKREAVARLATEAAACAQLPDAAAVMRPLTLTAHATVQAAPADDGHEADDTPLTLAQAINRALAEVLQKYSETLVFGQDVARKGGVYGVTRGLVKAFSPARVFDTILDEQSILGLALGAGLAGLLPLPEIQYLAYLHNAADQIRGEGATLQFFSQRQYRNPMVVRVASFAYQRGFGGHFHNDNAIGALRDIPGLIIAVPARPDDAAAMLAACVAAARSAGALCAFLEPIALYHVKDLHTDGDEGWIAPFPRGATVEVGQARTYGSGSALTILTFGNGLRMSLRVARRLDREGTAIRVVDLRWIAPLPVADILREAEATGKVLIVDETRRTGGVSEGVLALLADHSFRGTAVRVTSEDSFIPLGDAAAHVLVTEPDIEKAALGLLGG
ncbi:thiamine pyrophosphate-dependent enzyme [Hoyosella sp. YIM 151337]|uniref:thiamine pyrophosphate-dependent enzyme n=1 Tax=Hoyosella sp. YIM 151337 TaxID=2992742 RepID=UPI00223688BC|nr:thiamine pyrophosphate-dependent enzyme [Hoyosella sp. YIM 151337]MCW4351723.1 thiamine pyrophosphate-dependent enzyme [Hoyosella sp. YIM 151337]